MCFICYKKYDPRKEDKEETTNARGPPCWLVLAFLSLLWRRLLSPSFWCVASDLSWSRKLDLWSVQNRDYLDVYAVIDISVSLKTSSRILLTKGQSILSAPVPRRGIANLSTPCSSQWLLNSFKQAPIDEGVAWSHQFSLVICKILLLIKKLNQPSSALFQFL